MKQETLEKFIGENMQKENNFKQTEIGLIPKDWEMVSLGEVLEEVDIRVKHLKNVNPENLTVLSLTKNYGLIPQTKRFKKRIAIKDVANYKIVRKLQIVYNPYVIWEGAIHALRTMEIGIVSPVYCVWECKNNSDPSFIDRLLRTPKLLNEYLARASGVVNRRRSVSKDDFLNIKIPLPPLPEQRKIAKVLDKIQQEIEIQDRIIEQVKNLKKSLMQKLFTEGLCGEEQKETEIGLIPKSWEVVRLGEVAEIRYGKAKPKQKGNFPVVGSGGIYDYTNKALINTPTIVIGRKGTAGKCWLIMEPCYPSDTTFYLSWKTNNIEIRFLYNWMQIRPLSGEHAKTTLPSLQKHDLETFLIPLPSVEEQKQIAHILSTIDRKIEVERRRKQVLKELFKTMLHKLMSGEIRLKEVEI